MSEEALPSPGPSYLRMLELAPGDSRSVGMSQPQVMADDWWVALLWCEESGRLLDFTALGSPAQTGGTSPLLALGPALSGLLSGLIAAEGNRLQMRLRLAQPPRDAGRPWEAAVAVLAAFKFEPARVATMRPNELAQIVLTAFRDGLLRLRG